MPRTFYRNVHGTGPSLEDFMSDKHRGEPEPLDPVRAGLYDGISVFNTEHQARKKARAYPSQGDHIAEIELPDGAPVSLQQRFKKSCCLLTECNRLAVPPEHAKVGIENEWSKCDRMGPHGCESSFNTVRVECPNCQRLDRDWQSHGEVPGRTTGASRRSSERSARDSGVPRHASLSRHWSKQIPWRLNGGPARDECDGGPGKDEKINCER